MKLAIADPPYLGSANRWYGTGRGHEGGRGRADQHPDASKWDHHQAHLDLVLRLDAEFDGWAIAGNQRSLPIYLGHARNPHVAVWVRPNAMPSGARLHNTWEPVIVSIPQGRHSRFSGALIRDVLTAPVQLPGFVGAKPPTWTRWVLDMLGYDPDTDTVTDLFPGTGAVTDEVRQGVIA